ncbi:type IIL restriction-modification enzyme MmeI [Psychrobacter pacificensis]|uniref:type IIL restriction-modification enzyme MmeI n=1 Tax=Psychrobacter pacificensis TaxID=112002 RepID=UPI003D080949
MAGSNTAVVALRSPIQERSKMVFGNKPTDGGFLFLEKDEKESLLKDEPFSKKYIKKVLGAREFLHSEERWCLWFANAQLNQLMQYPLIKDRLDGVKCIRAASDAKSTRDFASSPHLFRQIAQPDSGQYILIPSVSSERRKYVPIGFFDHDVISTNANHMIPNGDIYLFGILNSITHNDWMRLVAGRLKSDYRYSSTVVYNTFPVPDTTDEQKKSIENLAEEILLARASNAGMTLAELYDPDKMPDDLKQAHSTLDEAVDKLYRPQGFANTEERLAHLLARYEQLVEAEKQSKAKKKTQKKSK